MSNPITGADSQPPPGLRISQVRALLAQTQQAHGDLPFCLKDADTGWTFPLSAAQFCVKPGNNLLPERLRLQVDYTEPYYGGPAETEDSPAGLSLSHVQALLTQCQQTHGDLPVCLKDADTGWTFPLCAAHFRVKPGSGRLPERLRLQVEYTDPHYGATL